VGTRKSHDGTDDIVCAICSGSLKGDYGLGFASRYPTSWAGLAHAEPSHPKAPSHGMLAKQIPAIIPYSLTV
jgi:hypothetical protein